MTWVWLKVGAKYDKCKYLLQKVREKVRIMKYKKWAHVTQLDVYLTNSAGLSGIQTRHTFRSSEGQLTSDEVLGHLITFYNMLKHCWHAQAMLKCASITEMCKHRRNAQSLLKFAIIAEMCNHCWHPQAMLTCSSNAGTFIPRDTLLPNWFNFEISVSVLNWTFIGAAWSKVLKTFSLSKRLPQVMRKMFCQNSFNKVYS